MLDSEKMSTGEGIYVEIQKNTLRKGNKCETCCGV